MNKPLNPSESRLERALKHAVYDGLYEFDDFLYRYPVAPPEELKRIRDELQLKANDILSVSFPKTGSTWVNEILYLIVDGAVSSKLAELPTHHPNKWNFVEFNSEKEDVVGNLNTSLTSPKLIKSHLAARFYHRFFDLQNPPRIVVTMRNPKDTLVSFYHFHRMISHLGNFTGTWDDFFQIYKDDALVYENQFLWNMGWLEQREKPHLLFVKYEDLHNDPRGEVEKIAKHVGYSLPAAEIDNIIKLTSFEQMSERASKDIDNVDMDIDEKDPYTTSMGMNPRISKFFRSGKIGDWKNYFSQEQSAYIDRECEMYYKPIDLNFQYE